MCEKVKCVKCDKYLSAIGNERKNGKNHNDWSSRTLHKKCWKELKSTQDLYFSIYSNDDENLKKWIIEFKTKYNLNKLL